MAFAIILVIGYHYFCVQDVPRRIDGFWSFGYLGVDIFMFCSGLGLSYGYLDKIFDVGG